MGSGATSGVLAADEDSVKTVGDSVKVATPKMPVRHCITRPRLPETALRLVTARGAWIFSGVRPSALGPLQHEAHGIAAQARNLYTEETLGPTSLSPFESPVSRTPTARAESATLRMG